MWNGQRSADGSIDRDHLERSRKVWDRRSDSYGRSEQDFAPMLDEAVERLGLERGDAVLEVGCGPGTNFERLENRVGAEGRIVAVDYSPKMVERARERSADHGWENVDVVRADASSMALESERFDGALASLSMSVLPDAAAAAHCVFDALETGSRFVVFDLRTIPAGLLRVVNPLLSIFFRWYANWNADQDVPEAVASVFGAVEIEETYWAGACYRAVATKDAST